MKIKRFQLPNLIRAIELLDQPIPSDADEKVLKRLIFDGKTRCDLGRNLKLVKEESAITDNSRLGLFQQLATEENTSPDGNGGTRINGKSGLEFQRQVRDLLNEEVEIPLKQIPLSAVKIDPTSIPIDAFSDLIDRVFIGEYVAAKD